MYMKKTVLQTLIVLLVSIILLPSCMVTRTSVGNYKEKEKLGAKTYLYDKGKQCYLFWGLLPLGRTNVDTPADGNCQIRTSYGFWDAFVSVITGGIFEMQTIKVRALRPTENTAKENKE